MEWCYMNKKMNTINSVLSLVISDIHKGKEKIFNIAESLKEQYEKDKTELEYIVEKIDSLSQELKGLERADLNMRKKLAEASMNFQEDEEIVKKIYDDALNVRVEYLTKQKEEKRLLYKKETLEKSLSSNASNIDEADTVIEQVSVVINYLQGDISSNIEMVEENNKIAYAIRFVEAQEKERNRIAREIHDGPAQYLASSLMRIDFCKMLLNNNLQEGLSELEDLKGNLKKTLKEVRNIIFDLKPPFLNGVTLVTALEDLKEAFQEECRTNIKMRIRDNNVILDYIVEVAVYRIVQEILTNVKKHAEAESVDVKIEFTEQNVHINIKDNGKGFDINTLMKNLRKSNKSYGLTGIYDRVEEMGGTIKVNTNINCGTEFRIKLPAFRGKDESGKISNN
ncbi:MAG: hypothetical protein E7213_08900 [Clostridium sp.]|nr:hypothetical protein [Clostridium sp.]